MSKRISVLSPLDQSGNGADVDGVIGVDLCDKFGNRGDIKFALLILDYVKVTRIARVDVNEFAQYRVCIRVLDGKPDEVGNKEASLLYGQVFTCGKNFGAPERV